MKLKDIVAISGEPGLFRFIAQGRNAIIVEHLETGRRSSAFGSSKVSSLDDISVFTDGEDIPLGKIFDRIFEKENGGLTIDSNASGEELKKYFAEVIPEYSRERVYVSDIKKMVRWYNILHEKELLIKDEPEPARETENDASEETPDLPDPKGAEAAPAKPLKKKSSTPKPGKKTG